MRFAAPDRLAKCTLDIIDVKDGNRCFPSFKPYHILTYFYKNFQKLPSFGKGVFNCRELLLRESLKKQKRTTDRVYVYHWGPVTFVGSLLFKFKGNRIISKTKPLLWRWVPIRIGRKLMLILTWNIMVATFKGKEKI